MDLLPQKLKKVIKKSQGYLVSFYLLLKNRRYFKKNNKQEEVKFNADKNLVYSLAGSKIPRREQFKYLFKVLDPREKTILKVAILILVLSLSYLAFDFYNNNLTTLPRSGGIYREGAASYPQLINPLYASARDIDADLASLVYSSLFKYDGSGRLQADLIDSWQFSEDGQEYSFKLKEGVKWHNGNNLNTEDVIFTFNLIKNPDFRSPLRTSLSGINIEKIDNLNFRLILAEPYADVLHLLTFGIMPKFAWESIVPEAAIISELNLKPIGSGPYKFDSLIKNRGGEMKEYHLLANPNYHGTKPYISKIIFKFFPNHNEVLSALNSNEVEGASYLPDYLLDEVLARHSLNFHYLQLPQINLVFFNHRKSKLQNINIRKALNYTIDRDRLLSEVLSLGEVAAEGPILSPDFANLLPEHRYKLNLEKAQELLESANFKKINAENEDFVSEDDLSSELSAIKVYAQEKGIGKEGSWWLSEENKVLEFALSASLRANTDVLLELQRSWEDFGIRVFIEQIAQDDLSEKLRLGDFELLFYGQAVDLDPDVAVFWHSSQIGENGLNIAAYKNDELDALLVAARQTADFNARHEKYIEIQEKIIADSPVAFLYSPSYIYIQDNKIKGFNASLISSPSDRFASISDWYIRTKKRFNW